MNDLGRYAATVQLSLTPYDEVQVFKRVDNRVGVRVLIPLPNKFYFLVVRLFGRMAIPLLPMMCSFETCAMPNIDSFNNPTEIVVLNTKNAETESFVAQSFGGKRILAKGAIIAARSANQLIAMVQAVDRPDYPMTQTYEIFLPKSIQDRRIGGDLLWQAMQLHKNKIHRIVLPTADEDIVHIAVSLGFRHVRTTWIAKVDIERSLKFCTNEKSQYTPKIKSLGYGSPEATLNNWVSAHVRHYKATHSINPIRDRNDEEWRKLFAGDDLLPNDSFFVEDQKTIIAHASLRKDGADWWFGWLGASSLLTTNQIKQLNLAAACKVIEAAHGKGATVIRIEADSTDPQVVQVMHALPHLVEETFKTYQTRAEGLD